MARSHLGFDKPELQLALFDGPAGEPSLGSRASSTSEQFVAAVAPLISSVRFCVDSSLLERERRVRRRLPLLIFDRTPNPAHPVFDGKPQLQPSSRLVEVAAEGEVDAWRVDTERYRRCLEEFLSVVYSRR